MQRAEGMFRWGIATPTERRRRVDGGVLNPLFHDCHFLWAGIRIPFSIAASSITAFPDKVNQLSI